MVSGSLRMPPLYLLARFYAIFQVLQKPLDSARNPVYNVIVPITTVPPLTGVWLRPALFVARWC